MEDKEFEIVSKFSQFERPNRPDLTLEKTSF